MCPCDERGNRKRRKKAKDKENALNAERDKIEADIKAGKKPNKPRLMCDCTKPGPAMVGYSVECGSKDSPGLDGGTNEFVWLSFQLPGQNARTFVSVEVTPADCRGGYGDTGRIIAPNLASKIKGQTTAAQRKGISVGSKTVPNKKKKDKDLDLVRVKFDSVCCVDGGSTVGKIRAFLFRVPGGGFRVGFPGKKKLPQIWGAKWGEQKDDKGWYHYWYEDYGWRQWSMARDTGPASPVCVVTIEGEPDPAIPPLPGIPPWQAGGFGAGRNRVSSVGSRVTTLAIPFRATPVSAESQVRELSIALRDAGLRATLDPSGSSVHVKSELSVGQRIASVYLAFGGYCRSGPNPFPWTPVLSSTGDSAPGDSRADRLDELLSASLAADRSIRGHSHQLNRASESWDRSQIGEADLFDGAPSALDQIAHGDASEPNGTQRWLARQPTPRVLSWAEHVEEREADLFPRSRTQD